MCFYSFRCTIITHQVSFTLAKALQNETVVLLMSDLMLRECKKMTSICLYLPIESKIKDLLSDDKLRETYLTNHAHPENMNTGIVSDIASGKLYKEMIEHDFSHNLSLTWNTRPHLHFRVFQIPHLANPECYQ